MKLSKKRFLLALCLTSTVLFQGCLTKTPKANPERITLLVQDDTDFYPVAAGSLMVNTNGTNHILPYDGFYISKPYAAKILQGVKLDQIGGDD